MPKSLMRESKGLVHSSDMHCVSPCQRELAVTDIKLFIVITERAKLDELSLLRISKRELYRLIEALRDVFHFIDKFRTRQKAWNKTNWKIIMSVVRLPT